MSIRKLKKRGEAMHGHYTVYSARINRADNDPFGELAHKPKELRGSFRSRVGISSTKHRPWRKHV